MTYFTPYVNRFASFVAEQAAPSGASSADKDDIANKVKIAAWNVSTVALIAIAALAILKSGFFLFTGAVLSCATRYAFEQEIGDTGTIRTLAVWTGWPGAASEAGGGSGAGGAGDIPVAPAALNGDYHEVPRRGDPHD